MKNKYNAKKTTLYGQTFDSNKEAMRYIHLVQFEKQGKIKNLKRQVVFELVPACYEFGKCVERSVKYKADFVYDIVLPDGDKKQVVEDTKGIRTAEYIIKRKLMLYLKGIRIVET